MRAGFPAGSRQAFSLVESRVSQPAALVTDPNLESGGCLGSHTHEQPLATHTMCASYVLHLGLEID